MYQETGTAAGTPADAAATGEVDDLTLNRMAMDVGRARAQAAELECRANELISQLPDDDIPREVAEARDCAARITTVAETIERELCGARTEREQGRRGMTAGRAQALGQQVGHLLQVAEAECGALEQVRETAAVGHKAEQAARAAPVAAAPVLAAKPAAKPSPKGLAFAAKKAAPATTVALGAASLPRIALPLPELPPEPSRLGRVVQQARAGVGRVAEQAQEVASDAWDTLSEAAGNAVDTVREAAGGVVDSAREVGRSAIAHTHAVFENPWQSAKDAAKAVLPAPVIGGLRTARNYVQRGARQLADSVGGGKDAMLSWVRGPDTLKVAAAPATPAPAAKDESLFDRAMRQAASLSLPLSLPTLTGQGIAARWADMALPSLPNIKPLSAIARNFFGY